MGDQKNIEMEMSKQLEKLSFVTESLRKEQDHNVHSHQNGGNGLIKNGNDENIGKKMNGKKEMDGDDQQISDIQNIENDTKTQNKSLLSTKIQHINDSNNANSKNETLSFLKDSSDDN